MISCTATEIVVSKLENNDWVLTMSQRSKSDFFFRGIFNNMENIHYKMKEEKGAVKMHVQCGPHFVFLKIV